MSLAGGQSPDTPTLARALALAFVNDVLPVAASGNTGNAGNPLQFPAAVLGGTAARPGSGSRSAPPSPTASPPTSPPTTAT